MLKSNTKQNINNKVLEETFKKIILRNFQILKSCFLMLLITHKKVERLNIEIPSLITSEQWRSLIFVIDIHSKC